MICIIFPVIIIIIIISIWDILHNKMRYILIDIS